MKISNRTQGTEVIIRTEQHNKNNASSSRRMLQHPRLITLPPDQTSPPRSRPPQFFLTYKASHPNNLYANTIATKIPTHSPFLSVAYP